MQAGKVQRSLPNVLNTLSAEFVECPSGQRGVRKLDLLKEDQRAELKPHTLGARMPCSASPAQAAQRG